MEFGGVPTGTATSPRVNKQTMKAYIGHTVALVGAVESHSPTAVVLRTSRFATHHVPIYSFHAFVE